MKIAVTGAGGLIGRAIVEALVARGDRVVALGRDPVAFRFPAAVERRRFDPNAAADQREAFAGVDAVIHLAGETVAGRWTAAKKRAIESSRVDGTRVLVRALAANAVRPKVLVCASAVGLYGSRGDEPLLESSAPGNDFLANVCVAWEAAAREAEALGIRTVQMRTGIVLAHGGALAAMLPPFRFGLGGPFGSGRAFVPWIHLDDVVAMYLFALDNDVRGAMNAVTPDYATSARFAQALGAALHRPALLPAPSFALHAVLGEFAGTILASQLVIPARAQDAGFVWKHPLLERALAHVLRAGDARGIATFESSQEVDAPLDRVFEFFSNPRNLERLTPDTLRFAMTSVPDTLERGSRISYKLRLHGIPIAWDTLIAEWEPPHRFVDVQLHGPYALWHHEHRFEAIGNRTRLTDHVTYVLPFAPFGNLARDFVRDDVERIFLYRTAAIETEFQR